VKDVKIEALHPTQMTHGLREIQQKIDAYKSLSRHDLAMAIASKPIPVVLGPHDNVFAIDHHHVAAALSQCGIKSVPITLVRDLSASPPSAFWETLENNRWAHPYDDNGVRRSFVDMPRHVWDLRDDEFRSLAVFVREEGGYEKTSVLLEEFRWADFFRSNLPKPTSDDEFAAMVKKGVELARSERAIGLPGYAGEDG
jgi:hypothetical protein